MVPEKYRYVIYYTHIRTHKYIHKYTYYLEVMFSVGKQMGVLTQRLTEEVL